MVITKKVVALGILLLIWPARAPAEEPTAARIRVLEHQLQQVLRELADQRTRTQEAERAITELRRQLEETHAAPAATEPAHAEAAPPAGQAAVEQTKGPTAPTIADMAQALVVRRPAPFVLPWGKENKLNLGGFIQANTEVGDVAAFEGRLAGGPRELHDRFRLRRARINLSGDLPSDFDFKLEGDFQQGDGLGGGRTGFAATDVFANWHAFPEANLKIGQYKAPFGLEQITSDTLLFIAERSLPTGALTPERQVGAQFWGKPLTTIWPERASLLTYYAGVFGGNNRNINVNDNGDFMYVGRLELLPYLGPLFGQDARLRIGGDGLYTKDAAGTDIAQSGNLQVLPDGSLAPFTTIGGTDHSPDERHAWSVDGWLTIGPFDVIGEYLEANVRPSGSAPNFSEFTANGYYLQPSLFVWERKLQLVARWERFNPGQTADDAIASVTGGMNYYLVGDNVKLMLDYIHTWSDFRHDHPGTGRDQFDEGLLRLQLLL